MTNTMTNTMTIQPLLQQAVEASRALSIINTQKRNEVLYALADQLRSQTEKIQEANQLDLAQMETSNPKYDRLLLTESRIFTLANDLESVAGLPDPVGKILEEKILGNGIHLKKQSVPLGVVGVIYEARPNVTIDVFSLCLKSGNVCLLKGGSDAQQTNQVLVALIQEVLLRHQLPAACVQLLPTDREATSQLMQAVGWVDVLIPRGSEQLIQFVRENAKVPVIETGAGIVHLFWDASGKPDMAANLIFNAKTRRPSVCNALDCLLVHQHNLAELPQAVAPLIEKKVVLYVDPLSKKVLEQHYPKEWLIEAEAKHYGMEFLSLQMSIKCVKDLQEALDHIHQYSSKHSEVIVTENLENAKRFQLEVDAAAVYHNVSSAFTDGAQFGMGAEIGISTQKLHARGPMGLPELTSYKWIVSGNGQTRNP